MRGFHDTPLSVMPSRLAHGEIFGLRESRQDVSGFAVAALSADPTREIGIHTHETAHFVLITSGVYLTDAHRSIDDPAPLLVYNPPGTTHRDRFARVRGTVAGTFLTIGIDAERSALIREHVRLADHSIAIPGAAARAITVRIARELRSWSDDSPMSVESLCLELAAASAQPESHHERPPSWLGRAREVLRDQFAERVTVAEVAREAQAHPVHLARSFRRFFGCSPSDYVRRCRSERAASLLASTTLSLAIVAAESGYADQSHMTKEFRRHYGLTPGSYRAELAVPTRRRP